MHPIAGGNHAPDHRFPVLAIAGPVARAKDVIGDVLQAPPRIANIGGPKAQQTASELRMASTVTAISQSADRGQAVVEPVVVGDIEMEDALIAAERVTDQVHPD